MGQANPIERQASVLLVEDEALILEMVSEALADGGFTVVAASNASEALRHLSAGEDFDVLFTDINLAGGMDGSALALRAREMRPSLPVVYASGGAGTFSRDKAVRGSTFVPKPYNPDHICRVLRRAVGGLPLMAGA